MSHIVEIKTEVRDEQAVRAACSRLKLPQPTHRIAKLFSASAAGLCVDLPDWRYPLVCELKTGRLSFDTYNGHWGEQRHLQSFLQGYAVEKAKIEARRKGYSCHETQLKDGAIKVTVNVGGAA